MGKKIPEEIYRGFREDLLPEPYSSPLHHAHLEIYMPFGSHLE
jgi:hypothetical protein